MKETLKPIIESLLFVAGEPLTPRRIQDALELRDPSVIREVMADLAADYEARGGGFYLDEVAGGYQLRTRPEFRDAIRRLLGAGSARLSPAALETLAIIAYRQPAMRADIDHVRGVDSGGVLRALLERRLIRVLGRKEIPGRPLIYGTTRQFLEVFGLRDLKDLPTLKEIAAMGEADSAGEAVPETAEAGGEALDSAAGAEGEAMAESPDSGAAPSDPGEPESDGKNT
jgi:segregation and condensation protein B